MGKVLRGEILLVRLLSGLLGRIMGADMSPARMRPRERPMTWGTGAPGRLRHLLELLEQRLEGRTEFRHLPR